MTEGTTMNETDIVTKLSRRSVTDPSRRLPA